MKRMQMVTQEQLEEVIHRPGLKEFGRFILAHCKGESLPDYKKMNLLEIPHLVPKIWVFDLREPKGRERLLVNFSGADVDSFWGVPLQGTYDMDLLEQHPVLRKVGLHRIDCIEKKQAGYSRRYISYKKLNGLPAYIFAECLFFPCSTDGDVVNWAVGCVFYEDTIDIGDNIFLQF